MPRSKNPTPSNDDDAPKGASSTGKPRNGATKAQQAWLRRGLGQPGGKLPLFDRNGQSVSPRLVRACLEKGWAEPWFSNPLKPDWLVCKLTDTGRGIVAG
jgi:hypothetical protein